jgi:hypothetical protein
MDNPPYLILLIEVSLSPIQNMTMTRYLMYKHMIFNMEDKKHPMTTSYSSQNNMWLKQG